MAAHYDGQLDVITEVWYDNIIANYEPHVAAGTIKILELIHQIHNKLSTWIKLQLINTT